MRSQDPVRIRPFVIELFAVKWCWVELEIGDRPTLLVGVFRYIRSHRLLNATVIHTME